MHDFARNVAEHPRVVGLLAAFGAAVMLTSCASGQIDLATEAPTESVATITGDRIFRYFVFYIYHLECGILQADTTSVDKLIGAKTVTVHEGVHSLAVKCKEDVMSANTWLEGDLSFFAQAGHEYTVGLKGTCIVATDNSTEAVVKSDCEPSRSRQP